MKLIKLHVGNEIPIHLTRENYNNAIMEMTEEDQEKYSEQISEKPRRMRYFAVCPACDNPTQIVGLYSKSDSTKLPYAKHYHRSTKIAKYNGKAYQYCPFASHTHEVRKTARKKNFTEFEKNIYLLARENFDLVMYIAKKASGIYFSKNMMKRIADKYYAAEGYMYYNATNYNIPWMFLYFSDNPSIDCNRLIIDTHSKLYEVLQKIENISLENYGEGRALVHVTSGEVSVGFPHHEIDESGESFQMAVVSPGKVWARIDIPIDPTYFLYLVHNRKYPKNEELLAIAEEKLPIFWKDSEKEK